MWIASFLLHTGSHRRGFEIDLLHYPLEYGLRVNFCDITRKQKISPTISSLLVRRTKASKDDK